MDSEPLAFLNCKWCGEAFPVYTIREQSMRRYCCPDHRQLADRACRANYKLTHKEEVQASNDRRKVKKAASGRAYYAANKARHSALTKARYQKHREEIAAWAQLNKESLAKRRAEYYQNHIEQHRAWGRNYRARKRSAEGHHSVSDIQRLYKLQKHRCATCKTSISDKTGPGKYHVDHVVALLNGGSNWPDNLQLLCRSCNSKKQAMDDIQWANEHGLLFC
jgi:5-methylcytosine-specific restriction endonuclease McrA